MMSDSARRRLLACEVIPGSDGVLKAHRMLSDALLHDAPAIALLPPDDGSEHVQRQRVAIAPDVPLEIDDIAAVVTTSGSSGDPTGVLLGRSALLAAAAGTHATLPRGAGRWLVTMPVTAVGGLMTLVRAIDASLEPVTWPGVGGAATFTGDAFIQVAHTTLALGQADGAPSYVSMVPTQLARIVDHPEALDCLARFDFTLIGAAALPTSVRDAAERAGVVLASTYGASETCGGVVYDGIPLPGVSVEIDNDDRVVIGGSTIAAGYRLQPDLTDMTFRDGRYRSADLGSIVDGVLTVHGRIDDVVKVGGRKVSLLAIVDAARSVSGVLDAAAVAVDDPQWGHQPILLVLGDASLTAISSAVTQRCGATRCLVRRVDSLPYLPNGKINRMALNTLVDPR